MLTIIKRVLARSLGAGGKSESELDRGALRLAMVIADDLSCLALLRQNSESLLGIPAGEVGAVLEDLLKFWVSPDAMTMRRQVGLI
jgi:hypothetical protein